MKKILRLLALVVVLSCSRLWATIAIVNTTIFTGSATSGTLTLNAPSTIGNWLICISYDRFGTFSVGPTDQGESFNLENLLETTNVWALLTTKVATSVAWSEGSHVPTSFIVYEISGNNLTITTNLSNSSSPSLVTSWTGPSYASTANSIFIATLGTLCNSGGVITGVSGSWNFTASTVANGCSGPSTLYGGTATLITTGTQAATFAVSPSALAYSTLLVLSETPRPGSAQQVMFVVT